MKDFFLVLWEIWWFIVIIRWKLFFGFGDFIRGVILLFKIFFVNLVFLGNDMFCNIVDLFWFLRWFICVFFKFWELMLIFFVVWSLINDFEDESEGVEVGLKLDFFFFLIMKCLIRFFCLISMLCFLLLFLIVLFFLEGVVKDMVFWIGGVLVVFFSFVFIVVFEVFFLWWSEEGYFFCMWFKVSDFWGLWMLIMFWLVVSV